MLFSIGLVAMAAVLETPVPGSCLVFLKEVAERSSEALRLSDIAVDMSNSIRQDDSDVESGVCGTMYDSAMLNGMFSKLFGNDERWMLEGFNAAEKL